MLFWPAWKSIKNRKLTAFLCALSIALSTALFLGIERLRQGAREGFTNTISQTDLIVGAKGGPLQLLLYTVFQLGSPTANIRYSSYEAFKQDPAVEWVVPFSLGDSYKGYRVVGTDNSLYEHYRFRGDQSIQVAEGKLPSDLFDVVLGHQVARATGHKLGDKLTLSHGISTAAIMKHEDSPFNVVGILAPTQTPIDRGVYITLEGLEAMHVGWETGIPNADKSFKSRGLKKEDLKIGQITSFLLKAKSRIFTLRLQRKVMDFQDEPLMGIIPGLALSELWQILSYVEDTLFLVGLSVLFVGLVGIIISLYTSLNERRREMAILRALGLSLPSVLGLLVLESTLLVALGCLGGLGLLYAGLWAVGPYVQNNFSVYLQMAPPTQAELTYLVLVVASGTVVGLIPGLKAYFNSVQDGLTIRT